MSSQYKLICLTHDPGIEVGDEADWRKAEMAIGAVVAGTEAEPAGASLPLGRIVTESDVSPFSSDPDRIVIAGDWHGDRIHAASVIQWAARNGAAGAAEDHPEQRASGTWQTVRMGRRAGIMAPEDVWMVDDLMGVKA